MKRRGLLVAVTAVSVLAGCGTAPDVPQWKDGVALPASPSVIDSEPAPAGVAAGSPAATVPTASNPAEPTGAAEPSPPATMDAPRLPAEFAAAVRGRLPEVAVDRRPEEITEIGDAACAELVSGQRRGTAVSTVVGYGVSSAEARELVRLARAHLCPP